MSLLRMSLVVGLSVLSLSLLDGCSWAQKTVPHLGVGSWSMGGSMGRDDFVVLDTVEGSSSATIILGGLIQIVDDQNMKIFGISFFTDKYTYFSEGWNFIIHPEDRAYYKALEQAPDADFVLAKSMDREESGIPILFTRKHVTFRGKALRLKPDK